MGCRILRHHIWGYSDCLCPIKGMPGLNELTPVINEELYLVSSGLIYFTKGDYVVLVMGHSVVFLTISTNKTFAVIPLNIFTRQY